MHPEALILRRCYPVPVTFADLRAAACATPPRWAIAHRVQAFRHSKEMGCLVRQWWSATLKQVTGAIDEVYAVVDGREVRVAIVELGGRPFASIPGIMGSLINLLEVADEQGYWERPHEVRLDLSPRPVSHGEVARAVLVGQGYVGKLC